MIRAPVEKKAASILLQSAGFQNITSHVYPDMRHEILNEQGNTLVYEEIKNFFAFF